MARDEPRLFSDASCPQTIWARVPVDVTGLACRA